MKREIHAATALTAFSWFPWKQTSSSVKRVNLSMNTDDLERLLFSINTSAETMSWKLRYCYFVIQRSLLFTQTKYLLILHFLAFIIFDLIFTKLNALRRPLLQTRTFWNYLDKFSGAATERKLSKRVLWVY